MVAWYEPWKTDNIKGETILVIKLVNKTNNINNEEILNKAKDYIKEGHSLKETSKLISRELNISSKKIYDLYVGKGNLINCPQ